jgi:tRNA G18 (ribose-2'-O)-methylase SpoU
MGSICHFPVVQLPWHEVTKFLKLLNSNAGHEGIGVALLSSVLDSGKESIAAVEYHKYDFCRSCVVVVGNEAHGIGSEATNLKYHIGDAGSMASVFIPMERTLESLNAAVAGAVVMAEIQKQRRQRKP